MTVCSTCWRNAFDASVNSRCASSKKNTSLGLSTSPISGRNVNRSASTHIRNVENITGRVAWLPTSSRVMTPRPCASRRIRSFGSSSGSPKNVSAPSASRFTSARRITPAVVADTAPSAASSGLPASLVRNMMTARRSFMSRSGRPFWSAQWKISPSVDSWVWLSPNTFDNRMGPKLEIVARTGTPTPPVPSDRNSTGKAVGVQSSPVSLARATILSLLTPGRDSPDRSPLMSAIITGTPAALSCSAITCSDLVLPVPVAPATRPCRLTVASGMRMRAVGSTVPLTTTVPSSSAWPWTA